MYIVGAGPGDPGLLTIKGKNVLQKADVVIYDRLVNKEMLAHAPDRAELIYAGKESGKNAFSQDRINELIVQKASEGRAVVRLKGGDPFVFGRGGEEALHLVEQGYGFEVVPGVTSASAVPAYAGIPLTHRGISSSFAVITGHGKKGTPICQEEISKGIDTLVFLMGMENLASIVEQLIANGKTAETPAALIQNGTLPEQKVLAGTLGQIARCAEETGFGPPALFIVGDVVELREKLNRVEKKPLRGKTVVITRPEAQADSFGETIIALGGRVVKLPVIEIKRKTDLKRLCKIFKNIDAFDWLVFTSANAVEIFFDELVSENVDIRVLKGIKICAIGPATEAKLRQRGILTDLVPDRYCAEGIVDALEERIKPGMRVLLPRAQGARAVLAEGLREMGLHVEEIYLYEAVVPLRIDDEIVEKIIKGCAEIIIFTSPSTVSNFVDIVGRKHVKQIDSKTKTACIGPITSDAARKFGFTVDMEAESYTINGLIDALAAMQ